MVDIYLSDCQTHLASLLILSIVLQNTMISVKVCTVQFSGVLGVRSAPGPGQLTHTLYWDGTPEHCYCPLVIRKDELTDKGIYPGVCFSIRYRLI